MTLRPDTHDPWDEYYAARHSKDKARVATARSAIEEAVRREAPVAPTPEAFIKGRWAGAYDALAVVRSLNGDGFHEPSDEALSSAEAAIRRMIEERHGPTALTEPVADTATVEELTEQGAQRDRLRAALEPAARIAHLWAPEGRHMRYGGTPGDGFDECQDSRCIEARAALTDEPEGETP